MEESKKNGAIDFWKFAFSIMIVLFHSYYFANNEDGAIFREGRIAVEFFFIVSGFFMAKSAVSKPKLQSNSLWQKLEKSQKV